MVAEGPASLASVPAAPTAAAAVPVVDDVLYWVEYQLRTMDDTTYTLVLAGVILVLALVILGIRPRY